MECGLLGNLVWSFACFMRFEVGVADDVHTRVSVCSRIIAMMLSDCHHDVRRVLQQENIQDLLVSSCINGGRDG